MKNKIQGKKWYIKVVGVVTFFTFTFSFFMVLAQSPEKMSYQAVIRNAAGELVKQQPVGMQVSILQGSADGILVFSETHEATSNENGLVSIEIGAGVIVNGSFAAIEWSAGSYFLKTETDPDGGFNYTISGTSQLLSVPYAMHAKTAEIISGELVENDPLFGSSVAAGITTADTSRWNAPQGAESDPVFSQWDKSSGITINKSQISDLGEVVQTETDPVFKESAAANISQYNIYKWNQKLETESDPVYKKSVAAGISNADTANWNSKLAAESDPAFSAWDKSSGITISESQISDLGNYIETETDPSVPAGTQPGQMQYWNGTAWITVAPGTEGQLLTFTGGEPKWISAAFRILGENDVFNPATGKIWMDRNLGASQVATSITDTAAFGDLYQWGRGTDGHEKRTSGTTTTLSTTDTPGHGNFIVSTNILSDWRSPQNDNLWQGVDGINNPCPGGYRLPTIAEWRAERQSWSSQDAAGAFASPLKLPEAGVKTYLYDEEFGMIIPPYIYMENGQYWSSSIVYQDAYYLGFSNTKAYEIGYSRSFGRTVRCIKD